MNRHAARALRFGVAVLLAAAPATADPRLDYMLHCQGCHGPDGSGAAGAAPSFRGFVGRFLTVPGGREYLIRVPGTSRSELDDSATASLMNWLVREFSPAETPADFVPYTTDEVARLRRPALDDPGTVRRQLLQVLMATEIQPR